MGGFMTRSALFAILLGVGVGVPSNSTLAQNAMQNLKDATSGQTTGQTFDGGKTPTDAQPGSNVNVPPVTGAPVSTGTAGGFSVQSSTGAAAGPRRGSEKTGK